MTQALGNPNASPRARRRRLAFAAVLALFVLGVAELLGIAGWWWVSGSCFTWTRAAELRAQAAAGAAAAIDTGEDPAAARERQILNYGSALHPYLGFVDDPSTPVPGGLAVSSYGFVDRAPPMRPRRADRFVVAVLGGSVALQMCTTGASAFAAELQKSPRLQGRTVDLVPLALGGYKQPQQLLAFEYVTMLGGEFDAVLALDGFNEIALVDENVPHGVPAYYPRSWARLVDTPSRAQQLAIGRLAFLRDRRRARAEQAAATWWSPLLQLWWLVGDRRAVQDIAAAQHAVETAVATPSPALTGPGVDDRTEAGIAAGRAQMVDVWQRCSLDLQALCARRGIPYFHFLQPNQYLPGSKPISAEEGAVALANVVHRRSVAHGYPLLQSRGAALRAGGVHFFDLTAMFRDHTEPLYIDDCCHLSRTGCELLGRRVAASMRASLDLDPARLRSLRATPAQLQFAAPVEGRELRVTAIDDAGVEYEVGEPAFGTTIDDAHGLVEFASDGRVRARRRGRGELDVRLGTLRATVPVVADWPDVLVTDDAPTAGCAALRLQASAEAANAAPSAAAQCSGLPRDGVRLLVTALQPIPVALPKDRFELLGTSVRALPADAATLAIDVPWPVGPQATDVPVFARVLVVAADGRALLAASNTVVLTRR